MNAVVLAVLIMLVLSFARVHVVISLIIGALVGGLVAGMGLQPTMQSFTAGIANGASIALSYALLGAFAVAIAHSGLPQAFARAVVSRAQDKRGRGGWLKWALLGIVLVAAIMSQNLVPIHIAFIPLLIPPLLIAFNRFGVDRRLIACILTFGLVTTYMYLPYGFGNVFLNEILLKNINTAGLDTAGLNIMDAMGIPALGMVAGLLIAIFVSTGVRASTRTCRSPGRTPPTRRRPSPPTRSSWRWPRSCSRSSSRSGPTRCCSARSSASRSSSRGAWSAGASRTPSSTAASR